VLPAARTEVSSPVLFEAHIGPSRSYLRRALRFEGCAGFHFTWRATGGHERGGDDGVLIHHPQHLFLVVSPSPIPFFSSALAPGTGKERLACFNVDLYQVSTVCEAQLSGELLVLLIFMEGPCSVSRNTYFVSFTACHSPETLLQIRSHCPSGRRHSGRSNPAVISALGPSHVSSPVELTIRRRRRRLR
jgi:hypothetical protein